MSAVPAVHVVCDGCGVTRDVAVRKFGEARETAETDGWRTGLGDGSLDYCPRCARPVAQRVGDEILASHGRHIVARQTFPMNLPPSEWDTRVDMLAVGLGKNPRDDSDEDAALRAILSFVWVEGRVIGQS